MYISFPWKIEILPIYDVFADIGESLGTMENSYANMPKSIKKMWQFIAQPKVLLLDLLKTSMRSIHVYSCILQTTMNLFAIPNYANERKYTLIKVLHDVQQDNFLFSGEVSFS